MANVPARGTGLHIDEPVRLGSKRDALDTHGQALSIANDSKIPETCQKSSESLQMTEKCHTHLLEVQDHAEEPPRLRSLLDTLGMCKHIQSI